MAVSRLSYHDEKIEKEVCRLTRLSQDRYLHVHVVSFCPKNNLCHAVLILSSSSCFHQNFPVLYLLGIEMAKGNSFWGRRQDAKTGDRSSVTHASGENSR